MSVTTEGLDLINLIITRKRSITLQSPKELTVSSLVVKQGVNDVTTNQRLEDRLS